MAGIDITASWVELLKLDHHIHKFVNIFMILYFMGAQSEVNFLGRLSHPNLVKLLGFGREDGELFLVYEFLHRGSLDNHLFGSKSR